MNRKFQHYVILVITRTLVIGYTSLAILGWFGVVYHLIFNDPVITFGGW